MKKSECPRIIAIKIQTSNPGFKFEQLCSDFTIPIVDTKEVEDIIDNLFIFLF